MEIQIMHTHCKPKKCKHVLKFCEHCDIVYCEKCGKEWEPKNDYAFVPTCWPTDTGD